MSFQKKQTPAPVARTAALIGAVTAIGGGVLMSSGGVPALLLGAAGVLWGGHDCVEAVRGTSNTVRILDAYINRDTKNLQPQDTIQGQKNADRIENQKMAEILMGLTKMGTGVALVAVGPGGWFAGMAGVAIAVLNGARVGVGVALPQLTEAIDGRRDSTSDNGPAVDVTPDNTASGAALDNTPRPSRSYKVRAAPDLGSRATSRNPAVSTPSFVNGRGGK